MSLVHIYRVKSLQYSMVKLKNIYGKTGWLYILGKPETRKNKINKKIPRGKSSKNTGKIIRYVIRNFFQFKMT